MADQIKRLKNLRKTKLSAFTRKQKQLQGLIDSGSDEDGLKESLEELKESFKALENIHDEYISIVDEED